MVTYVLLIPDKDEIVDSAYWPEDLDYSLVHPYTLWEVHVRYENCLNSGGPVKCVARVNLEGSPKFDDDFKWAIGEVTAELTLRDDLGEFNEYTNLSGDPVVDIGYEKPCCGGCNDGECCGGCACGG